MYVKVYIPRMEVGQKSIFGIKICCKKQKQKKQNKTKQNKTKKKHFFVKKNIGLPTKRKLHENHLKTNVLGGLFSFFDLGPNFENFDQRLSKRCFLFCKK